MPTFLSCESAQAAALAGASQVADGLDIVGLKASLIVGNQQAVFKEDKLQGWGHSLVICTVISILHHFQRHVITFGV
jgi:hypothetical protein